MGWFTRELLTVLWTATEKAYLDGNIEKAPLLTPKMLPDLIRFYLMVIL